MEEQKITEQESLQLIQQMIQVARAERREKGDGWLIWGWLLFIASASSAVLAYLQIKGVISWIWIGVLVVGIVLYLLFHILYRKKENVKTYVQELLDRLGTGFFISLFAIVAAGFINKTNIGFGYYYILYAFWMYIHGSSIRFRPLLIGAYVNWIAAIVIFLLDDFGQIMVVSAIAVLIGYLIPGYMLQAEYRKKMRLSE
jgi:Flp pilus assembly protein TadB